MNKSALILISFMLLVSFSPAQVVGGNENKKAKKEEPLNANNKKTKKKATGKEVFKEYQSWSVDAMGGVFLSNASGFLFASFGAYPRYNFIAPKDYLTVSVGSPLNLGFSFIGSSVGTFVQFMGDIPLTVDINIGSRATPFNESLFGGYLGAGLDYNYMFIQDNDEKVNLHTFGPTIHGGLRWRINGRETGFRVSYLSGFGTTEDPGNQVISISVVYGIK